MNWRHPTNQFILVIMLAVVIIGSGLWSLVLYIGSVTGWW